MKNIMMVFTYPLHIDDHNNLFDMNTCLVLDNDHHSDMNLYIQLLYVCKKKKLAQIDQQ